jgi:hypothetical protein
MPRPATASFHSRVRSLPSRCGFPIRIRRRSANSPPKRLPRNGSPSIGIESPDKLRLHAGTAERRQRRHDPLIGSKPCRPWSPLKADGTGAENLGSPAKASKLGASRSHEWPLSRRTAPTRSFAAPAKFSDAALRLRKIWTVAKRAARLCHFHLLATSLASRVPPPSRAKAAACAKNSGAAWCLGARLANPCGLNENAPVS